MSVKLNNSKIKNAGNLAEDAFKYLKQLQTGEKKLLKTGFEFFDCHLEGILPSDLILLAGLSGVGKTKLMFDILDNILNEEINPDAKKYVTLEYSLEMKFLNRILRDTSTLLKKKKSAVLTEEFSPEERTVITQYYKALQDNRRFICEESVTVKEFLEMTREFCKTHGDKEAVIIAIDHALLVNPDKPGDDTMKELAGAINLLRQEFKNCYFVLLSQCNRKYLENIKEKDNIMIPTTSIIYGSSHFEFLASWIAVVVDPFKLGVNEFLKVNPDRYDWLKDYMTDPDKKGKSSFHTIGNHFIFVLKTRESDTPYKNLFIKPMELTDDQLNKMKQSVEVKEEYSTPTFEIPTFTPPNFDMEEAFG